MGLLKAALGSVGGVMADQWREFFYCESLDADVLMAKGEKRTGKRSSNTVKIMLFLTAQLYRSMKDSA